jgi:hypothetical protein
MVGMSDEFPAPGHFQPAPESLTLHEQFRLVEIAATTTHGEIRDAALYLLRQGRIVVWQSGGS